MCSTSLIVALGLFSLLSSEAYGQLNINTILGHGEPKVASAWYAGWHSDSTPGFPLSAVSWSKYTHLTYSFAETTSDVKFLNLSGSNPDLLPQFVSEAHQHGVKALVSIGGWTGSRGFSTNVGSAENRTAFVKTVVDLARQYKLDGIDFDWEYPANQGIGCNAISPDDTANFLSFLQELRKDSLGSRLTLSAAVASVPFFGPDGTPLADVSGFAKVLDYIAIMNYDIWGPWSASVGPNAPLNDTCTSPDNQDSSAVSAVQKWSKAGMPLHQIVLGVAAYGHSFKVAHADAFEQGSTSQLAAYPPFDASAHPAGDAWDDGAGIDECGNSQAPGGDIDFWGMISEGFLKADGTPNDGIAFRFDPCSQTPYAYNATTEIMVSFDNAQSFAAKGKFIRDTKLRGFATWEAGGDFNDILLDSIRKAAGF